MGNFKMKMKHKNPKQLYPLFHCPGAKRISVLLAVIMDVVEWLFAVIKKDVLPKQEKIDCLSERNPARNIEVSNENGKEKPGGSGTKKRNKNINRKNVFNN